MNRAEIFPPGAGDLLDQQLSYWKEELAGAAVKLELPTDHPRPAVQSFRSATENFELPEELRQTLESAGRREQSTLSTALLTGFVALMHRYSAQDDFLVGTPVSNEVTGWNANAVVLRAQFTEHANFRSLLRQMRERTLGAEAHQDISFERLAAELVLERDSSHHPLFQVMFALAGSKVSAAGLAKTDLAFVIHETKDGLAGSIEYSTDLFDSGTIRRMAGHYRMLLAALAHDPDQAVSTAPMLTEAERAQLLYEWNDTRAEYPNACAHELFEQQVTRNPEAIALVFRGRQLSYGELNRRANQLAHYLRARGVGPDVLVGVCLERSVEMVVALMGIWKAGGAYVPLDPAYPRERLSFMLLDAAAKLLVTDRQHENLFPSAGETIVCLDADWPLIAKESASNVNSAVVPSHLAYVMYTSGSTGEPKGAMVHHSGLVNYLWWAAATYQANAGGAVPVHSSISFDLTVTALYTALISGGCIELLPEDVGAQNLVAALRAGENRGLVKITPAHLELLSQQFSARDAAGKTNVFVIGGENLLAESLHLWREFAPATRLINEYGPTETVVGCCVYEVKADDPASGSVPIGRPIANTQLYILDRYMNPLPLGMIGELYIGGAGVAYGYLNRPELTRERFLPDPFSKSDGGRLYKTGDMARYRKDGTIEYLGRIDNQVKVRGYRIELGEIEAALADHPAVKSCAVLAREDTPGNKQLVGYVIARKGEAATGENLREFLRQRLPEYMTPAQFVFLDSFPLTHNGKIDRKALPAPTNDAVSEGAGFVAPRTDTEKRLAAIWRELLNVENIDIHDSFFDLGGHSLMAMKLGSRIRDVFEVDLPIEQLFEQSTIADLANALAQEMDAGGNIERIEKRNQGGPCSLSFAQEQFWFLDQLAPGNPVYNVADVISFGGAYDSAAMKRAVHELVQRHDILRTTFSSGSGQPMQIVQPAIDLPLPEIDLTSLPEPARESEWKALLREEARHTFELSRAPLVRATMVHWSDQDHRLLLVLHHIIVDESSLSVIHREMTDLYAAFRHGRPSPLPELPIQFTDFARWQRDSVQGEMLAQQLSYWKQELAGAPTRLDVPADKARPAVQSFRGAMETFEIPKETLNRLKSVGRQEQATLFMTLEAAFVALMHRYTGQDDILVGTPISARTRSETEALIGCFLNTVVLRAQFTDGLSFRSLLQQVRERALRAYAHPDLPFEQLVAELAPERDLSCTPVFQVFFVTPDADGASSPSKGPANWKLDTGTSKFDLTLYVSETEDGLEGMMEYSTDLFEPQTIRRMCGQYGTLLEQLIQNPDQTVSGAPILPDAELRQLREWNDTAIAHPAKKNECLHKIFEAQVGRTPEQVALVFEQQRLSYASLNARANQIAHALMKRGAGPDVPVAIYCRRTADLVIGILGILKSGSAYVPLDPEYPKERLRSILEDAHAPIVLTQGDLAGELPAFAGSILCFDQDSAALACEAVENPDAAVVGENIAYVLFTSGSTGRPKGVALEHRSAAVFVHWAQHVFTPAELSGVLFSTSVCFDLSVFEMFVPLGTGGKVIITPNALHLPSVPARGEVTLINTVPSAMAELVRMVGVPHSVKTVNLAGEALPQALVEQIYATTSAERVYNLYGPTEDTTYSTFTLVRRGSPVTIGRPIAHTQAYILDKQRELVPIGVPGELYLAGEGLARGYYGRPDLTAERFVPNRFDGNSGARMYRTGDLCRWLNDGNIQYLGRLDHQVKLRGFRIELGEIEAILGRHHAVRECTVAVREDTAGDKTLVAYFAAEGQADPSVADLRGHLKRHLPDYMLPGAFVRLPKLPRTPNGKIDQKSLPAPDMGQSTEARDYVAPRNQTETQLAGLWAEILKVDRVGIDENFFELGGHSLTATQLVSRIRRLLGVDLPLQSLFKAPTVAGFAEYIEAIRWTSGEPPASSLATVHDRLEIEL